MKSVEFKRDFPVSKTRYQKGHLYINIMNAIVLCSNNNDDVLYGAVIHIKDQPNYIGDHVNIKHNDCPYEEFFGTVTLTN